VGDRHLNFHEDRDTLARLLDELAGVYRGESLGLLARELSALLDSRFGDRG
jgi:hypothetical protein